MEKETSQEELFWADQIAKQILTRKKFRYTEKKVPKLDQYTVKTSASLSGVLHIGRLSDTIRGDSVYRALHDSGSKAKLIWVAEDMDPLRKVPEGVPGSYEKYIGMPVTDIPDPDGNYESYAEKHKQEYFKVLDRFVYTDMEKFSMRKLYKEKEFLKIAKKVLDYAPAVVEIQNKYRENPLPKTWSPWAPICEGCGKIATPKVISFKDGIVSYRCDDYNFQKTAAKGCGHKGTSDPMKGEGKLMWKSEWAAQWAYFRVVAEGAGKEYQVPGSAFWVNAEICEQVLEFPMPEPIFYEHLMIDNVKMSASLGNVVYPRDWLEVASPELLRYYYNKRLMRQRSFSWKLLPQLFDEYDTAARIYFDEEEIENKREKAHIKRLYEISGNPKKPEKPLKMPISHAIMLVQTFDDKDKIISSLKKTGHYEADKEEQTFARLAYAKAWVGKYAPEDVKFVVQEKPAENLGLSEKQKEGLREIVRALKSGREWDEKSFFNEFYEIQKRAGLKPAEFFQAGYKVLLNKEQGPRLAPFILGLGDRAIELFEQVS